MGFFFQPTTCVGTRQPGRDDDHDGAGSCGAFTAGGAADVKQLFSDPLSGAFRPTPNILAASISRMLSRRCLPPPVNVAPWIRRRPKPAVGLSAVPFGWSGRTTHMAAARRPLNPNCDSGKLPRPPLSQIADYWPVVFLLLSVVSSQFTAAFPLCTGLASFPLF